MKSFLVMCVAVSFTLFGFITTVSAQQTPLNTVCNEKSGLQWDMNIEADMASYNVYVSNAPDIALADPPINALVNVTHPTGTDQVTYTLDVTMSEGDKYFTVSALDLVGNESGMSNEIGCDYDISPNAPFIQLIFTTSK